MVEPRRSTQDRAVRDRQTEGGIRRLDLATYLEVAGPNPGTVRNRVGTGDTTGRICKQHLHGESLDMRRPSGWVDLPDDTTEFLMAGPSDGRGLAFSLSCCADTLGRSRLTAGQPRSRTITAGARASPSRHHETVGRLPGVVLTTIVPT